LTLGTAIAIVVVSEVSGLFTLAIALTGVVIIAVVEQQGDSLVDMPHNGDME
jgi:hypothetical protein